MTAGAPLTARPCRDEGCDVRVVLARRQPSGAWAAFEATTTPPESIDAHDCWVLVGEQAWRREHLVEQFHTSREISEEAARGLVHDYPWHKPHHHRDEEETV